MIHILLAIMMLLCPSSSEIYSVDSNFEVSRDIQPNELGHVRHQHTYKQTGWDKLYIYTNPNVTALEQHRAAGFLEGYSTYAQIYAAYKNFVGLDFKGQPYAPENVQTYLDGQLQFMDYMVRSNPDDQFWTYVGYYLEQLRFMHIGYLTRIKQIGKPQLTIDFKMIYYLPSVGDLEDLITFSPQDKVYKKNCNGYVRLDGDQLFTTHGTHNRYSFLLRTYKFWSFPRKNVPLQSTAFTSRPGDMISKDDFYVLSTGLRVTETSLSNENPDNLKELSTSTVPSWLRTVVANHLSNNISQWISYFLKWRSGTHNNQWLLVDPSKIKQKSGLAVFFEQAFSLYKIVDMTQTLQTKGYVASYNTPFTQQVFDKLGYDKAGWNYNTQPRGIILHNYHPKMTDIQAMKYWLVNNEWEPQIHGLSPRYDLSAKNKAFGMTDCKVSSEETIRQNYFWAISGPPVSNGKFPPFDWRKYTGVPAPREGLVDVYDYSWQRIQIDIEKKQQLEPLLTVEEK